jgi:hypothetical protein
MKKDKKNTSVGDDLGASQKALAQSYEDLPHKGRAFALSHPGRLAAIARLFGPSAPAVADAWVLDLGGSETLAGAVNAANASRPRTG